MSPQSDSSVTLRDIAGALGVSHGTVSRALHDNPRISLARRRQIQAEAARLGYRPNPIATALGQQRQHMPKRAVSAELGWINCWDPPGRLRGFREFDLYWKGAYETAWRNGYRLQEFACGRGLALPRLEKILAARNIRGLLLPPQQPVAGWDRFGWHRYCAIRFGYSLPAPPTHIVTSDQVANAVIAFDQIRRLGYRRIGFVTGDASAVRFKAGFLMRQMDTTPVEQHIPVLIAPSRRRKSLDYALLPEWLKRYRPDAVLTDLSTLRGALEDANYQVPADLGLASLSVLDGNSSAGLDQNSEAIGQAAMEMLISLLSHNHYGQPDITREMLITGRWVDGDTLPPRIAPAARRGAG